MPMYTSECAHCSHIFDFFSHSEQRNEVQECPVCSSKDTWRIMTAPAVVGVHSHRDGSDRGGAYKDLVEAAKLERTAANLPANSAEKRGLMSEASKLKEIKPKTPS